MQPELHGRRLLMTEEVCALETVICEALTDINKRSGGDETIETQLRMLRCDVVRSDFMLWVTVDGARVRAGMSDCDSICGFATARIITSRFGKLSAIIEYGWIRPGYAGQPFDHWLPSLEKWAKQMGATKLISCTERTSLAIAVTRLVVAVCRLHLNGLLAYARWIGRRGFRMRETTFEKNLT